MAELHQFNLSDFAGHPSMIGLTGVVNADWGKTATDRLQAELQRKRERRGEAARRTPNAQHRVADAAGEVR